MHVFMRIYEVENFGRVFTVGLQVMVAVVYSALKLFDERPRHNAYKDFHEIRQLIQIIMND